MFSTAYRVFDITLSCIVIPVNNIITKEKDVYKEVLKLHRDWRVIKIDLGVQIGFPDHIAFKGPEYRVIESKYLRKEALNSIVDDLHFEPGQIPYMYKALKNKEHYLLFVGKQNFIAIIGDSTYVWKSFGDAYVIG